MPSGTAFSLEPPNGLHFNSYSEMNIKHKPPTFPPFQSVIITPVNIQGKILTIPSRDGDIYTVQHTSNSTIHKYPENYLTAASDPKLKHTKLFPFWIKHKSLATFIHNNNPIYGSLIHHQNNRYFHPGTSKRNKYIFSQTSIILHIQQSQTFKYFKVILTSKQYKQCECKIKLAMQLYLIYPLQIINPVKFLPSLLITSSIKLISLYGIPHTQKSIMDSKSCILDNY